QNENQFVLAGKIAGNVDAVALNFFNASASQPRHLPRMWREHKRPRLPIQLRRMPLKRVKAISIEHNGDGVVLHQSPNQLASLRTPRNTRTDSNYGLSLSQLVDACQRTIGNRSFPCLC